MRDHVILPVL